jgi:dihydropteroate synthase
MGILNRTPDSFSDGGRFVDDDLAIAHVEQLIAEGASIIDVGGESTRPGSHAIAPREQIARVGGAVRAIVARGAIASIDTTSPEVAAWALDEGARIINTVSLEPAEALAKLARDRDASLVLMHARGNMQHMAGFSVYDERGYDDVVKDVAREWRAAADRALATGLDPRDLVLDPGLGFAKNAAHSLAICQRLQELVALGFPVLVGVSRKSFLAKLAPSADGSQPAPTARLGATIAATLACASRGAAIVRTHDVAPVRQALIVARAFATTSHAEVADA